MSKPLVLVTGGCGYIGSHTVIELLDAGFDVVSIDNLSKASTRSLDQVEKITGRRIKNYDINLVDYSAVEKCFQEIGQLKGIIHFAAFKSVPESVKEPEKYYENNLNSLVNILRAAKAFQVSNFVFSSSCSVYGDIDGLPVSEATVLSSPKSPYAATKVMGEQIVTDIAKAHHINAISLRYFNPVGAHISGLLGEMPLTAPDNLVPVITQTAIGKRESLTVFGGELATRDGSCIRDYVHVMDIAKAHVLALRYMENKKDVSEIVNLGTGQGVSVLEAINMFLEVSGTTLNYKIGPAREGDVIEIYSDTARATELLGWKAEYGLREMMDSAWKWELYMKNEAVTV